MDQQPIDKPKARERSRWLAPRDWPLLAKILLGMVAVVLLALGVATAINAFSLYTDLREEISADFESLATSQMENLSDILSEQLNILRSITLIHEVQDSAIRFNQHYTGDLEDIKEELLLLDNVWLASADSSLLVQSIVDPKANDTTRQLLDFQRTFPDHVEIFLTDRYGALQAATGRTSDYYQADEGWWQAAYNDGQGAFYISQPEYDESAGHTALDMAMPIFTESGELIGIARTTYRIEAIYEAVGDLRIGETGHVAVVDSTGLIVADPNPEHVGESAPSSWVTPEIVGSASGWQELLDAEGEPVLAGHASLASVETGDPYSQDALRSLGWVLFVVQDQAEAYAAVAASTWQGILIAGAFALVAAGLALVLSRAVVTPITDLVSTARGMAAGDLSVRAEVRRRDETGELAEAFNTMADEIAGMVGTLEQRVAQRTRDLEAAAEVARATTSLLDLDRLLHQVVDLVRERFDLYYVGLFLVDERQQLAVLRAGTGEAGRQMLAQAHALEIGGESMIGRCVASGDAAIALDVGEAAYRFDNPLLPDTHSEMALPFRSRGRVVGAMTVQDTRQAAFDESDIAVMQTMADQVAVAIDNARLFAEAQAALEEMERTHQRYLGESWAEYSRLVAGTGYAQTETGPVPLDTRILPETRQVMAGQGLLISQGEPSDTAQDGSADVAQDTASSSALVVPLMQYGQAVGALGTRGEGAGRQWTVEEIAMAEAIAEQFSLAVENLRLLEETQRRAAQERLVGEVSANMRQTLDVRAVLETAADELYQRLGLDKLVIHLTSEEESHRGGARPGGDGDSA